MTAFATVVFLAFVGASGSVAEERDPADHRDNKFSPWVPRISGLGGFCGAYGNGRQKASITLSNDGKQVQVEITGPGGSTAEHCGLKVAVGTSAVESGSAAQIGDTAQTCTHNAPVWCYETMRTALENGNPHCYGFDRSYRPENRASR